MSAVVSIAGEPVLGSPSTLNVRELTTWSDFDLAIVGPALSGMSPAAETSWQGVGFALVHLDSEIKPSQQLPTDDAWVCIEAFRAPTAPSLVANGHLAAYTVGLLDLIDTPVGQFTVQTFVIDGSGPGSPDCATSPVLARGPPLTITLSMVPFSPSRSSIGRTASSAIRRGDTVELQLTLRDSEDQVVEITELTGKIHVECGDFATALGRAAATSACIVDKSTIQVHADKAITVSLQVLSSGPISVFAYVLGALVSGAPLDIHVEPAVFSTGASFATDAELSDAGPRRLSDVLPSGSILIAHEATSFELRAMKFTERTEWPAETQFRVRTSGEAATACQVTMPSSVGGEPLVSINCSRTGSLKLEFDVQVGGPPAGWELLDTFDPVVVDGWPAHAAISPPANVVNGFCRTVSVTWRLPSLEEYSAGLPRWLMYFAGAHVTKRWCDAPSGGSCFEAGMEATERAWLLPSSGAAGAVETQACAFGPNLAGKDVWLELRLAASNFTDVLPPVLVRASEPTRIRAQPLPFPPNTRAVFFSADPAAAAISCGPSVWGNSTSAPASCARLPDGAPGTAVAALQLRDRLGNQLEVLSAREIVRMGQVKAFAKVDPAADAVPLQVAACNSSLSNSTWPGLDAACKLGASVAVLWPASLGASDAIITATVMGRLVSLRGDGRLWQRTAILREATSERSVLMRPASEPTVAAGELFWASHGLSEPPGGVVECSIPIGACPAGHSSKVLIRAPGASLLGHATCSVSAETAAAARPAASPRVSWLDVNASLVSFQSGSTRAVSVEAGTLTDEAASVVLLSDDGLLAVARAPLDAVARASSNPLLPTCTWCPRLPPADALTLATIAHRDGGEAALRLQPRIPGVFDVVVGFARAPPSPNASHQLFPSPEWARLRVEPIVNGTFSVVASLPRCALSSSGVSVAGPASVPGSRIVLGDELSFTVRVASVLEAGAATDVLGCRLEDAGPFDRIDLASAAAIQLQAINQEGSWVTLNTSDVHVETRLPGSVFEVSARTCNAHACLERLVGVKAGAAVRIVLSNKTTAVALAAKPLGATLVLPPSLSHSVKLLSVGESELAPQARPGLTQLLRMRVRDSSGAPFACGGESVLSDVRVTATGRQSMLPQCRSSAPSQKGCAGPAVLARCAVDADGQTSAEVWFPLAAGPDDDALRVEVSSATLNQSASASLSVAPQLIRAGAAFAGVASASAVRLTVVNGTVPAAGELAQVALHADALCEGDAAAQPADPWIKALALSALAPEAWACTATSQADGLVLPVEVLDVAGPTGNECVRGHSLALMRMPSLAQAYSLSCAVGGVLLEHVEPIIVSAGVASADHSFVDGFSALWQDLSSHSSPRLALTVRDRFGNPAFLTGSEALAAAVFVGAERSAIAVAVSSGAAGAVTLTLNSSAALPALTSTSSPLWNAELRVAMHGNVSVAAVPLVSGPPATFAGASKEQPGARAGNTTVFQIHALSAAGLTRRTPSATSPA
ncbi:hypothetical protein FNF29_03303 [Cafeteria roenbergensis]|uniref:Uncharacterized protein n=1 Tax=Cafeteria roenbergensis TaxID=33653 RepID=A0A5A8CJ61_CAFRO|nr:hypothetical protein FNF29_03303 [Cafeteria roenbergensis]|eukprot:KAA0153115.1 hypothetical protein FNF29_03303 [Cafeteria roenbergensis]